ncbi:hypothetical protein [Amycolatopsis albispora]|uniref:Uncharacterized protein n=1 Tax=Amycolatopsis albispora TaxID=1804986 RepID=A0A344L557_9PSEU|nr:hypothetical protein [Amycolatopsis albispora]AXB43181.1 hypothetical protein A4R43_11970 [Amycolatopsis albispora]
MRAELGLALRVPRWAWRFYLRHLPLVAGLSLIPSLQRLLVVGGEMPGGLVVASEVLVGLVRLGLVAVVAWLAFRGQRPRMANASAFFRDHWRSLVLQGVLLSVAFAVFDVVAERVVGGLLPESARQGYLAWLLFLKNPTIIALTFIWWIGLARQVLCTEPERVPAS